MINIKPTIFTVNIVKHKIFTDFSVKYNNYEILKLVQLTNFYEYRIMFYRNYIKYKHLFPEIIDKINIEVVLNNVLPKLEKYIIFT